MTSAVVRWMDRTWYPGFERRWDDEILRQRVAQSLDPSFAILDFGAGRGNVAQMNFRGQVREVAGTDPDPIVLDNPFLDRAAVLDIGEGRIPFEDESFDLVFADNVLEHLRNPGKVFAEIARVLKPGGKFLAKTPNRYHYMPAIAAITPIWFHQFYNRLRGRETEDTFPTVYACNTPADVRRWAETAGLDIVSIDLIEGRPEYLRLTALTYAVGALYERVVNSTDVLAGLRCVLLFEAAKPDRT